ncbi:hypothetical protein CNECB9_5080018 [Cupriavidus necator]|uniref:Uncharacterized protein n=1 Tax=Cupriavidus necator TaxID=106590 RepID=A0A1K0JID5_CUPNE|nr:hypothetical protein CNECB9_5080018 [Cupriavidus necator]
MWYIDKLLLVSEKVLQVARFVHSLGRVICKNTIEVKCDPQLF